jgi:site-specific DNA-methyltransferase (adenine-specific)/modification methylase
MEINKLYNENCLDTLGKMPDKFVDLVVTSPPYNMRTRIRNGQYTTREKSEHFSKKYKHFDDDLSINEFYSFHSEVLRELLRVSKIVCYNFQIVTGSKEAFFKIIGDFNRNIKDIIIWDKGSGQPAMHGMVLNSCYEMILILEDDKKAGRVIQNAKFNRGEMNNILRIGRGGKVVDGHSAVFPERLAGELIKAFSEEEDLVYDPFMGSGTTGMVANKLNRNWIGSEITQEYCKIATQRIQSAMGLFSNSFQTKFPIATDALRASE